MSPGGPQLTAKDALWAIYLRIEKAFVNSNMNVKIDRTQLPPFMRVIPDAAFGEFTKVLPRLFRLKIAESLQKATDDQAERFAEGILDLVEPLRHYSSPSGSATAPLLTETRAIAGTAIEPAVRDRGTERERENHASEGVSEPV